MEKRNVLMIEYDMDDRYITEKYFVNSGYDMTVEYLPPGSDIIPYLSGLEMERMPHLVLMSGRQGLNILRQLKTHGEFRQIPVIVLTELTSGNQVNEAYALGANSVIEKPSTHQLTLENITTFSKYWFSVVKLPSY